MCLVLTKMVSVWLCFTLELKYLSLCSEFSVELKYLSLCFEFSVAANIYEGLEPRTPALQLELPLEDVIAPHDDQVRAPVACGGRKHSRPLSHTVLARPRHQHALWRRPRAGLKQPSSGCRGVLPHSSWTGTAPLSPLPAAAGAGLALRRHSARVAG